ncbi:hypothetical protein RT41_GL000672 [Lactococcus fujiensis JCM 16395]|uniref:Uncharacterized protein n=2 Tax=Lactococcus fujiensis TaxID=610251 RepID=A0A2A5RNE0_9LACT|nr:hypothetical protein RT41_GL000672 [Lactococcus fujiensis JCM 16395]
MKRVFLSWEEKMSPKQKEMQKRVTELKKNQKSTLSTFEKVEFRNKPQKQNQHVQTKNTPRRSGI